MKKFYIKMNDNDEYLSLGNVINVIKKISNNQNAMQTEIFCSIFDDNNINTTTVNNYCIGIRAIGIIFKKRFNDKYLTDKNFLIKNVLSIVSILDNKVYSLNNESLNVINNNLKLKEVIKELLVICKNDKHINNDFIKSIKSSDNFNAFIELLNYAINLNKQPIYKQDNNVKINKEELEEYLVIKLYYGQSYISSLMELARKNNMYACAELASMYFDGSIDGVVDYQKSYDYYLIAAEKNHPKACWMIANLMLKKLVKYDFDIMWKYLNKSISLNSAAGYNTLGLCYLKGINKENKIDKEKAKHYFELSSNYGYVYAFNNLGKMYESDKNKEEALKYYKISADMFESWALNKVGEYYRINGNDDIAFEYYNKAISCPLNERSAYAYYNLAKYYYEKGCKSINIKPDKKKVTYYYEMFKKLKGDE